MPDRLDITVQRNEDWQKRIVVTAGGEPVDLTDMDVRMQVKSKTSNTVIATATITKDPMIVNAADILMPVQSGALGSYGDVLQSVELKHDLILEDVGGEQLALFYGSFTLARGITA